MLSAPHDLFALDPRFESLFSQRRDLATPAAAAEAFAQYFGARFAAAVDQNMTQVVMLSGGIDSIVTLAAMSRSVPSEQIVAVTVAGARDDADTPAAAAVAATLGIAHLVTRLDVDGAAVRARDAITALGCDELWEVGAAVCLRAARDAATAHVGRPFQMWSGDGGDELFGDSRRPAPDATPEEATASLAEYQRLCWTADFTRDRLTPDFFERVLPGQPLYKSMVTFEAAELAARCQGATVWGDGVAKEVLRVLAEQLGIPSDLARRPKSPMQHSSGLIGTFLLAARATVAALPGSQTYRDTDDEPVEHSLVRLWLHHLT